MAGARNLDTDSGLLRRMSPGRNFAAVTPSDTVKLATGLSRIYVGGAGAVAVKNSAGVSVTFAAVPAGTTLPILTDQVMSTNTTATSIVALGTE